MTQSPVSKTLALAGCALGFVLGGCAHGRRENAALIMAWPASSTPEISASDRANRDYPSVGGDLLKGSSLADLEAARAAAAQSLEGPDKPNR